MAIFERFVFGQYNLQPKYFPWSVISQMAVKWFVITSFTVCWVFFLDDIEDNEYTDEGNNNEYL